MKVKECFMARELGEFLGFCTIVFFVLAMLNYVVKFINRKFGSSLKAYPRFQIAFSFFLNFIVKWHKLFGLLSIMTLLAHFLIQLNNFGIRLTGVMAAILLLVQGALGIYGAKARHKGKSWIIIHRTIAVLLLVAIIVHVA
jgi:hypothetical protein